MTYQENTHFIRNKGQSDFNASKARASLPPQLNVLLASFKCHKQLLSPPSEFPSLTTFDALMACCVSEIFIFLLPAVPTLSHSGLKSTPACARQVVQSLSWEAAALNSEQLCRQLLSQKPNKDYVLPFMSLERVTWLWLSRCLRQDSPTTSAILFTVLFKPFDPYLLPALCFYYTQP